MAPPVRLFLLATVFLSLAWTLDSVPARSRGLRGWTLNSAGYLLGPVTHLSQMADSAKKREAALRILDLLKAIDVGLLEQRVPKEEEDTLQS